MSKNKKKQANAATKKQPASKPTLNGGAAPSHGKHQHGGGAAAGGAAVAATAAPAREAQKEQRGRPSPALRRLALFLLIAAALAWATHWRSVQDIDPVAVAVDHLNDTLRTKLNVSLPNLPDLDLPETWRALNETVKRRLNLSLPDIDSLPDLVDSLILGLNVTSALGAISSPFAGQAASGVPRPGQLAAQQGLRAKHPIVIIPGFVTSGLELWEGQNCAAGYFRQSLWAGGSFSMGRSLLSDKACWLAHMSLDPVTGSDPPGIKLRAARSLEAVDWFVPGYWVFSKIVQSLADIGYDNGNMIALAYDWRLPVQELEGRDAFFTRAKAEIELQRAVAGIKPVLVSHSYGAVVTLTFLSWAEAQSPGWTEENVHAYVNLAGTLLGVPKAIAPLLSGETRDTTELAGGLAFLFDSYLSRTARAQLARSWGSLFAMLPIGGSRVWGNTTWAPDDIDAPALRAVGRSLGSVIARVGTADKTLVPAVASNDTNAISAANIKLLQQTLADWVTGGKGGENDSEGEADGGNGKDESGGDKEEAAEVQLLDVDGALKALAATAGLQFTRNLQRWSAAGTRLDLTPILAAHEAAAAKDKETAAVADAAGAAAAAGASAEAGSCAAGTCSDKSGSEDSSDAAAAAAELRSRRTGACSAAGGCDGEAGGVKRPDVKLVDFTRTPLPAAPSLKVYCMYGVGAPTERGYHYLQTRTAGSSDWTINQVASDSATGLDSGIQLSDGDGTVPLLSLGALCEGGWRTQRLNPAGARVVVREYRHEPKYTLQDPRGGPGASTHVEILGNDGVLTDLLRIASGAADAAAASDDDDSAPHAVRDRIVSAVQKIATAIDWEGEGDN